MSYHDPVFMGLFEGVKPKPRMTLSEWAEAKMVLPPERSASPGPYRVGDATYQRGMMDAITDPDNEDIVFVTSSQVGKTSILTAAQGFYCEADPTSQLSAWPNQDVANAYQSETFEPTLRDSPDWKSAMTGPTEYKGGFIKFVGANTPSKLAMTPIRVVTGDEVDRWPQSSGKEGSPVELAKKRRTTYHNRKGLWVSTPLHLDTSLIVKLFRETRQHYFHVKCPDALCGHTQVLQWDNVIYTKGKEEEARYQCEECGVLWDEMQKRKAVREGKWEHLLFSPFKCFNDEAKPEANKIGFWICELYSPWVSMAQMAVAWTAAEGNPELEQTFFNTRLGLPYEGNVSSYADPEGLMARREKYNPLIVPAQAGLLTSAADVQDDRIEVLTVAWGRGEECWVLDHQVIPLDPSTDTAWEELARIFGRAYQHAGAANLKIGNFATTTDSGGHFTQQAYKFSNKWMRAPHGKRWFAHKGVPGENKPLWVKSEMRFKDKTKLFLVGVDDGKTTIYTRYAIEKPGPGYIHMHDKFDEDAMRQFSAERAEVEYVNGFPKRKWVKARHRRNELLDMLVYNLAVRNSVNVDIEANIKMFNTPPALEKKPISAFEIGQMYK